MVSQDLNLMSALLQKMDWTENRQKLIAANIANADTPGYTPQDLEPLDFKGLLEGSTSKISLASSGATSVNGAGGLTATDPAHITASGGNSSGSVGGAGTKSKKVYETSPSGNGVVLEEQLVRMNANYSDHAMATNLYLRNMALLKASLKSS